MFKGWFSTTARDRHKAGSRHNKTTPTISPDTHNYHAASTGRYPASTSTSRTAYRASHSPLSIAIGQNGNVEIITPQTAQHLQHHRSSTGHLEPSISPHTRAGDQHSAATVLRRHDSRAEYQTKSKSDTGTRRSSVAPRSNATTHSVPTDFQRHQDGYRHQDSHHSFKKYPKSPHPFKFGRLSVARSNSSYSDPYRNSHLQQKQVVYLNPTHPRVVPSLMYIPHFSQNPTLRPAVLTHANLPSSHQLPQITSSYDPFPSTNFNVHPYPVPHGWFNQRGDQYIKKGVIRIQPEVMRWHPIFASYPKVGRGWMDEEGSFLPQTGGILKH